MSSKKRVVYLSAIVVFAVLLHLFFEWSYPYLYSEALCYFFSPIKEESSDYYVAVFLNVVASGAALLFAKLVLRKLHDNRLSGIGAVICTDLVLTHLAVCLFTAATFWFMIDWPHYAVMRFLFSALFYICLLIFHKKALLKAVAVQEKRSFQKARLLLYGVLAAIPIAVAAFQVYFLIFSIKNYEYSPPSPVALYFLPVNLLLQPLVTHIFNPEFLWVGQWSTFCEGIFSYCLLAVLADCSNWNLFSRKSKQLS